MRETNRVVWNRNCDHETSKKNKEIILGAQKRGNKEEVVLFIETRYIIESEEEKKTQITNEIEGSFMMEKVTMMKKKRKNRFGCTKKEEIKRMKFFFMRESSRIVWNRNRVHENSKEKEIILGVQKTRK